MDRVTQLFRRNKVKISPHYETKVCFITAIHGNKNASCKKYMKQTAPTDFICFTDNPRIVPNGWIIDTTPYQDTQKYYKQSFRQIPRLQNYDIIVWLDSTVEIVYDRTSEYLLYNLPLSKIIWDEQSRSIQEIDNHYKMYVDEGYSEDFFSDMRIHTEYRGIWITHFIAYANKDPDVIQFLDMWSSQPVHEQIGFHYAAWKMRITPRLLPSRLVKGKKIQFYVLHEV